MTQQTVNIEPLGDHDYLVNVRAEEDIVTLRVRADPAVVTSIGGSDTDESQVVAATIAYLTERQPAVDLPADLDLQDVAAAYDGYIEQLHEQLS